MPHGVKPEQKFLRCELRVLREKVLQFESNRAIIPFVAEVTRPKADVTYKQ